MHKYMYLILTVLLAISCGTATMKIDPIGKSTQQNKKDCKDSCKGLKGKERADCNKRCN